jgi:CheY-like chemotaxis protein
LSVQTATSDKQGSVYGDHPPRILVADDDTDLRAEIVSALIGDGFVVVEAKDGNELLDLVARSVADDLSRPFYDAIITDVAMPGFSGLDVLTALRSRTARTPVMVITGFEDTKVLRSAQSLGAVSVFRKPFDLDKLRAALVDALGKRPRAAAASGKHR